MGEQEPRKPWNPGVMDGVHADHPFLGSLFFGFLFLPMLAPRSIADCHRGAFELALPLPER